MTVILCKDCVFNRSYYNQRFKTYDSWCDVELDELYKLRKNSDPTLPCSRSMTHDQLIGLLDNRGNL